MGDETTIDAGSIAPGRPQGAGAYLVVRVGEDSRLVDLNDGDEITLGRADDAEVQVDDQKASREHARVRYERGALTLTDLGSRNGTLFGGVLLRGETRVLGSGDVFWIGEAEIVVAERAPGVRPSTRAHASTPASEATVSDVVVADRAMLEVFRLVERVAPLTTTVLLLGETGVGKEVVAQQIHDRSARAEGPFIRLNCGAVPDNLLESELFGHERGAFTGADKRKLGLLESATGGTLFLDEIGELKLELQSKLLRAIDSRRIMRVGGREDIDVDVRIISATNRDLETEVGRASFRDDLYFRLSAFTIRIPPLRDRPNEIGLLAELFLRQLSAQMKRPTPSLDPRARALLERHAWPGNVRELKNAIERSLVLSECDRILPEHLPPSLGSVSPLLPATVMKARVASAEQRAVEEALAAENGNQTRAARRLGISRRTLIYKLEKYQLRAKDKER